MSRKNCLCPCIRSLFLNPAVRSARPNFLSGHLAGRYQSSVGYLLEDAYPFLKREGRVLPFSGSEGAASPK